MSTDSSLAPDRRLRRRDDRGVQDLGWSTNRLTFSFADYHDPDWMGVGPLRVLIESEIDPHEGFSMHPHRDVEILSYVVDGTLRHRDSGGHEADLTAGEMQLISAGRRGIRHAETNPAARPERHYQLWLTPAASPPDSAYHRRDPFPEQRRAQLLLYASPDGRNGSLPLRTDAFVYAGLFAPGDAVRHPLGAGRQAWLQVVDGAVRVGDVVLRAGDGLGVSGAPAVPVEVTAQSDLLLVDLPRPGRRA
jgi:hypothetical protein